MLARRRPLQVPQRPCRRYPIADAHRQQTGSYGAVREFIWVVNGTPLALLQCIGLVSVRIYGALRAIARIGVEESRLAPALSILHQFHVRVSAHAGGRTARTLCPSRVSVGVKITARAALLSNSRRNGLGVLSSFALNADSLVRLSRAKRATVSRR